MSHGLFQLVCGGVIALSFFATIGVVALLDHKSGKNPLSSNRNKAKS